MTLKMIKSIEKSQTVVKHCRKYHIAKGTRGYGSTDSDLNTPGMLSSNFLHPCKPFG
jgi:hypothetical protein